MHVLLSLALGAGALLLFQSLTRPGDEAQRSRAGEAGRGLARRVRARAPAGVGLGALCAASSATGAGGAALAQILLGWPVVTLASAAVAATLPAWYLRQREERRRAEVEEALGEAVETLRDAVRIGLGVEECLRAMARTGPRALRGVLAAVERDIRLHGFEEAIARARERLDEPLFDTLCVALLTSYRIGGRNLAQVLDGISQSLRGSVRVRREVRSQQAQNVLSARVIAALPLVLVLVIRATNPNYLTAFSQPAGQALLGLCLLSVACGYAVMLRQARLPGPGRLLR